MTRPTNIARTGVILQRVLAERLAQELRYGAANETCPDGTGPETRWLLPFTGLGAKEVQEDLRVDYEDFEEDTGAPTWVHLVREEIAEAFQEADPGRLAAELVQVAALCVSWVERLAVMCEECGNDDGPHLATDGRKLCLDCLERT